MTINTDLLLEIREQITSHPETHDQALWGERDTCGTTHCIAGWAATLSGARLNWVEYESGDWGVFTVNDDHEDVPDYAARVMGLEDDDQGVFFATDETALRYLDRLIEKGKNAA